MILILMLFFFSSCNMPGLNEVEIKKIIDIKFVKAVGGYGSIPGKFLFPSDVLILPDKKDFLEREFNEILVVDKNNNRIQKFDSNLDYESAFGSFGNDTYNFNSPYGIVAYTKNYIYISDSLNHRIVNYDIKGNFVSILNFIPPAIENFDVDRLRLSEPKGIDVDSFGNIYIADSGNDRILKVSATGQFLSEIKGDDFEAKYFLKPSDVKIDDYGNIYIADTGNDRVLVMNQNKKVLLEIKGLKSPAGITTDNKGNIFVSNTAKNKVVVYNIKNEPILELDYKFNMPLGLAIFHENLYVVDSGNHQIVLFRIEYDKWK